MTSPRRHVLESAAGGALLAAMLRARAAESTAGRTTSHAERTSEHDGSHDFDFWFGRWHVANERLKERLVGSTEWERFEATQECQPILGGIGNIDDFRTDWNDGFVGMTLRLFDLGRREWSLYWAGNRDGVLQPPVVGRFENGVGTFFGRDVHRGTPVRVRFLWSEITAQSALWQQAFSTDEGENWETNWIMRMTRIAPAGAQA